MEYASAISWTMNSQKVAVLSCDTVMSISAQLWRIFDAAAMQQNSKRGFDSRKPVGGFVNEISAYHQRQISAAADQLRDFR
jgi:hypothetical protein